MLDVDNKIRLIEPKIEFASRFFDLVDSNREFLNQFITFAQNKDSVERISAFLHEIASFNIGGQKFNLLIEYSGEIVGLIGFHKIDRVNAKAEIGYWLGEPFQGRGILTKAMPVFLHYGFEGLAVNRVELLTLTSHQKSINLAERVGFVKEGVLKEHYCMHDAFQDAVLYRMLKKEFLA